MLMEDYVLFKHVTPTKSYINTFQLKAARDVIEPKP